MKIVVLWTDLVIFLLILGIALYSMRLRATPHLAATWAKAFRRPSGAIAATILSLFIAVGLLDSIHFRSLLTDSKTASLAYSPVTTSLLDVLLYKQVHSQETTYSAPLATRSYSKENEVRNGELLRSYPRLTYGGAHLSDPDQDWCTDVVKRGFSGAVGGLIAAFLLAALMSAIQAGSASVGISEAWRRIARKETRLPWLAILGTLSIVSLIAGPIISLAQGYHVFGTDRVGTDLLYLVLKSVRTALVIGTMTTLVTLPIAVGLGILAGYLRGWVDEIIQYVYTVINSIPYVLLIAASVLILMVFIDSNPDMFQTSAERTDARLFFLCVILGMTSWTELCRLIRGEVMKLRELEYVQAAQAFGVRTWQILSVHLLPNVMHLILINIVISFSGLVLAEAVLSYVGVGVDPAMASFGTLINTARLELSKEPAIWWTLATSFVFMFTLVLSANIFSDAVRDAFDPRSLKH
jgi:peptide/nickel transport system permease protein